MAVSEELKRQNDMQRQALRAAGRLAVCARSITGGRDHNGQKWGPATVKNMSERIERLQSAVNEYDTKVVELCEELGKL